MYLKTPKTEYVHTDQLRKATYINKMTKLIFVPRMESDHPETNVKNLWRCEFSVAKDFLK